MQRKLSMAHKLWIGGILLAGAIGYLAYAGMNQGWVYYVSVDQLASQDVQRTSRMRLMGTVAAEGLEINGGQMTAKFVLAGQETARTVAVNYRGAIPDLFKVGAEVVVEGKLDAGGKTFDADVLLTKCASKYEGQHAQNREKGKNNPLARTEKRS